jgi:hypothetical protein
VNVAFFAVHLDPIRPPTRTSSVARGVVCVFGPNQPTSSAESVKAWKMRSRGALKWRVMVSD